MNGVKALVGDRVTFELSPYEFAKGRLAFRHAAERSRFGTHPIPRNHLQRR